MRSVVDLSGLGPFREGEAIKLMRLHPALWPETARLRILRPDERDSMQRAGIDAEEVEA